ncbi:MAG: hypothetical protein QT07_C0008G0020 [archaeon GW2011_AR16]|nr:MAG: hypothetical protein QT07_C0008G0020 [archaeon GW2011_AR16]
MGFVPSLCAMVLITINFFNSIVLDCFFMGRRSDERVFKRLAEKEAESRRRLDLAKHVLAEMNQEEPTTNYAGDPIPTMVQRYGPLVAWVIYCSGNGAENEHLALIGARPEAGHERVYIITPTDKYQPGFMGVNQEPDFYLHHQRFGNDHNHDSISDDVSMIDTLVRRLYELVEEPRGPLYLTPRLDRVRIAFNWCTEDPRHDTLGYATVQRLRRAIVERYDPSIRTQVMPERYTDPGNPHQEPRSHVVETREKGYHRPFLGSAEFHWEQRFPSAYPIIRRLEELTQTEKP